MPLIYGKGEEHAFIRPQEEINKALVIKSFTLPSSFIFGKAFTSSIKDVNRKETPAKILG
jgi:hypothetical protein